ncbi:hypothetical protein EDB89DRAFT_1906380 [Lactarius sanguifluus]|nr:hypothetical protein EDB89DRAFT_1906380 [Lactarius sanguifluus]
MSTSSIILPQLPPRVCLPAFNALVLKFLIKFLRILLDKQSVMVDMIVKPTPCTQGHIAQWFRAPSIHPGGPGFKPQSGHFLVWTHTFPFGLCSPLGYFPIGLFPIGPLEVP